MCIIIIIITNELTEFIADERAGFDIGWGIRSEKNGLDAH